MNKLTQYGNYEIDGNLCEAEDLLNLYRLQKQLLIEEGIVASLEECYFIWIGYSNDLHAGWLFFPSNDDDIIPSIKNNDYFVSFENYI